MKLSTQLLFTVLSKTTHSVSVFTLSIILSRYLTKDEYGTYLHVQLITNFCVWAFLLGIPHSVYYFLPSVANKIKFLLCTTFMVFVLGVITAVAIYNSIDFIADFMGNSALLDLVWIIFFLVIFQVPYSLFEPIMISAGKIKTFSYVSLIFNISFFFVVAVAVFYDQTMTNILKNLVVLYSIQSAIFFISVLIVGFENRHHGEGDDYSIREQMSYSMPIGLSMGIMEASKYTDKIIVSNQASVAEYAEYTRGAVDIPIINIISNTLDNLLMPQFVKSYKENDAKGMLESWHSVVRVMAAFIYPCCLFLICTASLLIPALFSEKYIASVIIFQIYTLGLLSRISTFNIIIRAIGKTQMILYISVFTIFANIILTYKLMELWGLIGAPMATVITLTVMRCLYLLSITHYLDIRVIDVFPWKSLLHSLLAALIASIPIMFLLDLKINVWLHLFLLSLVYSVGYIYIVGHSKALLETEKEMLRSKLPSRLSWII